MRYSKVLSMAAALAITATGLFLVASPASGEPRLIVVSPADVVTRHINYADLNLASAAGQARLVDRVRSAVGSLCDEAIGANDRTMRSQIAMNHCAKVAWSQAQPQISQTVLRLRDSASTGSSSMAAAAITIVIPQ